MEKRKLLLPILLLILGCISTVRAQENSPVQSLSRSYVVEVTYFKDRPFAYQRIGGWTWYGAFQLVAGYKSAAGVLPVEAVKLYTREEEGVVKVKIAVLRGKDFEFEDPVAEYSVGTEKVSISELSKFGVVPFELALVRAPTRVAQLPSINNQTKSLLVSTEPASANIPAFKARFLNNSPRTVAGFSYYTFADGRKRIIGMPQHLDGTNLISPGATYELNIPYALKPTTQSAGEVPESVDGLALNVIAVFFSDGTYEGDRNEAIRYKGYKMGEKIQLTRILELLHSKFAGSWATLAPKVDELRYRVAVSDIGPLLKEFPGLTDDQIETARDTAEVSASRIQKDFVGTFGSTKQIDPSIFAAAVNGAIAKCQKWLDSLP